MKKIILSLIFLLNSSVWATQNDPSHYKGYFKINDLLFNNVLTPTEALPSLGIFIGEPSFSTFGGSLLNLLGYYDQRIGNGVMKNGNPNAVNLMIYHILFEQLANKIANDCSQIEDPITQAQYQQNFYSTLKQICLTPLSKKIEERDLYQIWMSFVAFSAPMEEYQAWLKFMNETPFTNTKDRTLSSILSLLMNPYFLIET